jgi:hypothetical protein
MERFLGLTQDEIKRNQKLWMEENDKSTEDIAGEEAMRSAGITPGGIAGDLGTAELGDVAPDELGEPGEEELPPEGGPGMTPPVIPPVIPPETPGL